MVIAGNHDISFDDAMLSEYDKAFRFRVDADEVRFAFKSKTSQTNVRVSLLFCPFLSL